jgi:hypothetical protein
VSLNALPKLKTDENHGLLMVEEGGRIENPDAGDTGKEK